MPYGTKEELSGQRFGHLTVVRRHGPKSLWYCVCDCGNNTVVRTCRLLSGNNKSCGCRKRAVLGEAMRTHGLANSRITGYTSRAYGVWQAMKDRCSNPHRIDYHRYGGRGITVCSEWAASFETFLKDMGEPPIGLTLERENNNVGYCKANCKWATRKEQALNRECMRKTNMLSI